MLLLGCGPRCCHWRSRWLLLVLRWTRPIRTWKRCATPLGAAPRVEGAARPSDRGQDWSLQQTNSNFRNS
eukprot:1800250-Prymnesium_polylepis.1